jgi:hypothetical protein
MPCTNAREPEDAWPAVAEAGLALAGVQAARRYDGSPVLKVGGCFMAGLTSHPSAEPHSLVVRVDLEERQWLLEDAPSTYYITDYHRPHPVVLVRLQNIDGNALRDLLASARRVTLRKVGRATSH